MKLIMESWTRFLNEDGLDQVAGVGSDDESFNVRYKIRDLIAKANKEEDGKKKYPVYKIPTDALLHSLEGLEEDPEKTDKRIKDAELKWPIIVVANDEGKIFAILDGTHRARKAVLHDLPFVRGHVIPKRDMVEFTIETGDHT